MQRLPLRSRAIYGGMMSRSSASKSKASLSICYDYFCNKDKKKKKSGASRTAISSALQKLDSAQERGLLSENSTATQDPPVAINSDSIQPEAEIQPGGASQFAATLVEPVGSDGGTVTPVHTIKKNMAEALVDPTLLWDYFFSGIMDDTAQAVEDNLKEHGEVFNHSVEFKEAKKRGEWRFGDVCNFPLKLNLTPLQRGRKIAKTFASILGMRFGPLHASLQVGDVILEWNDTSLVTPCFCAFNFGDQVIKLDMQPHSKWVDYTAEHHSTMREAAQELDYSKQIELTYTIASKKKELIDALIEVIVRYNTLCYYNIIDRNCQHFVLDALKALQVSIPKELPGSLGEYYSALVKGRTPSLQSKFTSHSDLDKYVMRGVTIADMPQHDLEFILALYFRFHLESRSKLTDCKALGEWQCEESHCCMEEVEKHIEKKSMKIHNFQAAR